MSEEVPMTYTPIDFDDEEFINPFSQVVPGQMDSALKKMGIKKTWEMIKSGYFNENFAFNDDFFKGENPTKIASNVLQCVLLRQKQKPDLIFSQVFLIPIFFRAESICPGTTCENGLLNSSSSKSIGVSVIGTSSDINEVNVNRTKFTETKNK
jgi:hypothetical protein